MVTIDTTHDDALCEVPFARETIYDGHILHVEKWRVTCPNGREAPREIVVHKGAAAVVPVFDNGDTLLVRQHRVAVDRVTLEIPAGKLEAGEEDAHLEAAVRELREETGAVASELIPLGPFYPAAAYSDEVIWMYLARGLTFGEQQLDDDEFLNLQAVPLDELARDVLAGRIPDAKTQAAILRVYCMEHGFEPK